MGGKLCWKINNEALNALLVVFGNILEQNNVENIIERHRTDYST